MIEVIDFIPGHLDLLEVIPEQQYAYELFSNPDYHSLLTSGPSFTVVSKEAEVIACLGLYAITPQVLKGWALISNRSGAYMGTLTRKVHSFLEELKAPRVETVVVEGFDAGHKWMRLLGFKCETPDGMENMGFSGETYYLYSKVSKKDDNKRSTEE